MSMRRILSSCCQIFSQGSFQSSRTIYTVSIIGRPSGQYYSNDKSNFQQSIPPIKKAPSFLSENLFIKHIPFSKVSPEICDPSSIKKTIILDLPTGLGLPVSIETPSPHPQIKKEAVNDIKNRREKMRKHKRKKWARKYKAMIRDIAFVRERKLEAKFQEKVSYWKKRSDGFSPKARVEERLNMARRNGFFIDILKTDGGLK